jgi:hypothetical protein
VIHITEAKATGQPTIHEDPVILPRLGASRVPVSLHVIVVEVAQAVDESKGLDSVDDDLVMWRVGVANLRADIEVTISALLTGGHPMISQEAGGESTHATRDPGQIRSTSRAMMVSVSLSETVAGKLSHASHIIPALVGGTSRSSTASVRDRRLDEAARAMGVASETLWEIDQEIRKQSRPWPTAGNRRNMTSP